LIDVVVSGCQTVSFSCQWQHNCWGHFSCGKPRQCQYLKNSMCLLLS